MDKTVENEEVVKTSPSDPKHDIDKMVESEIVNKAPDKDLKHGDIDYLALDTANDNKEDNNDDQQLTSIKRPKRLAALKFRKRMKDILPCLKIAFEPAQKLKKEEIKKHGWNYDD